MQLQVEVRLFTFEIFTNNLNQNDMSNFSNSIGNVINKIYEVRGEKIMLDNDLAQLYGVRTNQLREAVRKNMARFPEDFIC